ncbi:hypothetical protein G7Z17_g4175 [Cylindrodendrum hubeiense]|uniref:Invertebrate defensins family profile domain-containing protein n=1 Tax=Cylindrodendrum hubeiense TaxID=595255 RepID=A0A9P5HJN4_9HYPO|nr:hypothetical protein G7Z17_g4175 [Cylindrodendrum hubeiense]
MKFFSIISMALFAGLSLASPIFDKRSSCQLGSIGPANAGNAACSASCLIQHGNFHGGHCDADATYSDEEVEQGEDTAARAAGARTSE